ncbi:MAG: LysM peptidoglycan-binding domain-containing protein [Chloroflexota bacterium]
MKHKHKTRTCFLLCIAFLWACTSEPVQLPTPTADTATCGTWTFSIQEATITCLAVGQSDEIRLVQSPIDTEITLSAHDITLVLAGTSLITRADNTVTITSLEGRAVVGALGRTRILSPAQEVQLTLENDTIIAISDVSSRELRTLLPLPLSSLPRAIVLPVIVTSTPDVALDIPESDACPQREGWTDIYTVQSGDVLSRIASRFDTTVVEMITGNCLANASNLQIGQQLRVPVLATPTPQPESTAEATENVLTSIGLRADSYAVASGGCTILRWDVQGATAIYLDDVLLEGAPSSIEVCPAETTVYTVQAVFADETDVTQTVTIVVQA